MDLSAQFDELTFNEQYLDEEVNKLKRFNHGSNSKINIFLLGCTAAGKSSFINSILSVYSSCENYFAETGGGKKSQTQKLCQIHPSSESQVYFWDSPGDCVGLEEETIEAILDGKYQSETDLKSLEDKDKQEEFGEKDRKITCVVFLADIKTFDKLPQDTVNKIRKLLQVVRKKELPIIIILTKVDLELSSSEEIKDAYRNEAVKTRRNVAKDIFKVDSNRIFVVANYHNDIKENPSKNCLLWFALSHIFKTADHFLSNQLMELNAEEEEQKKAIEVKMKTFRENVERHFKESSRRIDILLLGSRGSGKSSFINSVLSLFEDRKVNKVPEVQNLKEEIKIYQIKANIPIWLWEMPGWSENQQENVFYPSSVVETVLDGDAQKILPSSVRVDDYKICCAAFFLDAEVKYETDDYHVKVVTKLSEQLQKRGIIDFYFLTKTDKLVKDKHRQNGVREIQEKIKQTEDIFAVPEGRVLPVSKYKEKWNSEWQKDELLICAMEKMLSFASIDSKVAGYQKKEEECLKYDENTVKEFLEKVDGGQYSQKKKKHILLVGPCSSGKSSLINSIISMHKKQITKPAITGAHGVSIGTTKKSSSYDVLENGILTLWDTPGFTDASSFIMTVSQFQNNMKNWKSLHCGVAFVLDISCLEILDADMKHELSKLADYLRKHELSYCVILTKVDLQQKSLDDIYNCSLTQRQITYAADLLRTSTNNTFVVANYTLQKFNTWKIEGPVAFMLQGLFKNLEDFYHCFSSDTFSFIQNFNFNYFYIAVGVAVLLLCFSFVSFFLYE